MSITINPLEGRTFGATVNNVRLADIEDGLWEMIHSVFLEFAVLIFPDQHLTEPEQNLFALRFGAVPGEDV